MAIKLSWVLAHPGAETFKYQSKVEVGALYCGAYFLEAVAWSLSWLNLRESVSNGGVADESFTRSLYPYLYPGE